MPPSPISHIPEVEKQSNLTINVLGWDKGVTVHRLSKQPQEIPRINLLLLEIIDNFHYTWIKNLNRLLNDQIKHRERKNFCERCLHGYRRVDLLEAQRPECRGIARQLCGWRCRERVTSSPSRTTTSSCRPLHHLCRLEALTTKVDGPELDPTKSKTQRTQHHEVCSYSYIVVRCDGQTEPPVEYRGPNAAEHFLGSLQEEECKIKSVLADPKAMRITRED